MERLSYEAGKQIFGQGANSTHAYLVVSGSVEVDRYGFSSILERGELFGVAALVDRPRMARAVAKTDCVLVAVSKNELMESIRNQPDQALEIIDALLTRLAAVIDELNSPRR